LEVITVVAERNEKIKEQFATHLHLGLHSSAALEGLPAADYQS
jgi:hypothetical protein